MSPPVGGAGVVDTVKGHPRKAVVGNQLIETTDGRALQWASMRWTQTLDGRLISKIPNFLSKLLKMFVSH